MAINAIDLGTITASECYTLDEFSRRSGLKKSALRMARQRGLIVRRVHNRGYILGSDWLEYLGRQSGDADATDAAASR